MAIVGAKPKADRSQVRHRIQSEHEWAEYEDVPYLDAPALPPRTLAGVSSDRPLGALDYWPDATVRWYRAVSRMPHARAWTPSEWEQVFLAAEIHARTMEGWKGYGGAEIRIREAKLGTSAEARRDLRIRYVEPGAKAKTKAEPASKRGGNVVDLDDHRGL